jgi:hypothetical protein
MVTVVGLDLTSLGLLIWYSTSMLPVPWVKPQIEEEKNETE